MSMHEKLLLIARDSVPKSKRQRRRYCPVKSEPSRSESLGSISERVSLQRRQNKFQFANFLQIGYPITIVMYHSISRSRDSYTISPEAFRYQIECIRRNFSVIRLHQVEELIRNGQDCSRVVAITFDDAFDDFLEFAFPVLEQFSVPATLFVPTGFIGRSNEWDFPYAQCSQKRIMSGEELQELHQAGLVDFGSHTVDHRQMSELRVEEMRRQAVDSKHSLEDLLSTPVDMLAYPYGQLDDFSPLCKEILSEVGYRLAVTTHWGTRHSAKDLLCLRRISFREADDEATIQAKVKGFYNWIGYKMRLSVGFRAIRCLCRTLRHRSIGTT
jgi:peptidoglycan/xylan/chitin deacetylase (PgdA/CDA1 family)